MSKVKEAHLSYYLSELTTQSQYAAIAAEHLNEAYDLRPGPAPDPGLTRSFAAIQALLGAGAVVSKLLWNTGSPAAQERARRLREVLTVTDEDFPVLRNRAVRDSLEHVDERIDAYLAGNRPPLDLTELEAGVPSAPLHGDPLYLRRIDPSRGVVEVLGRKGTFDEVPINDLVDEMLDIQRRVNSWFNDALAKAKGAGPER